MQLTKSDELFLIVESEMSVSIGLMSKARYLLVLQGSDTDRC